MIVFQMKHTLSDMMADSTPHSDSEQQLEAVASLQQVNAQLSSELSSELCEVRGQLAVCVQTNAAQNHVSGV